MPRVQFFYVIGNHIPSFKGNRWSFQTKGWQINQRIECIVRCKIRQMMRNRKRQVGDTTDVTRMLVGVSCTMVSSFASVMRWRSASLHIRTDTKRLIVMMVWKHTYHQHPQADQQQTICTEYLLHSFSVGHKNTKKSPKKQKSRIRVSVLPSQYCSTSPKILQYFLSSTPVLPRKYWQDDFSWYN